MVKIVCAVVREQGEKGSAIRRYGIQAKLSNGETVIQEDLSTDRPAVEAFCRQLQGEIADRDQLRYLMEDFVVKNVQ